MADTKRVILEEAVKLFARDGYEAVSVEMIAEAVGIKAPSLYKHYKSKRDIFDHILREMERRDAVNASECDVPTGTAEEMPEAYRSTDVDGLLAFCRLQFRYWTQDSFASPFRRMLTLEQYRSPEMRDLYHQYLGAGPLEYVLDLVGSREMALTLYGPMFLLYSIADAAEDKEKTAALLDRHLENWRSENC